MKRVRPVPLHSTTKKAHLPKPFIGRKLLTADEWNRISIWVRSRMSQKVDDILALAKKERPVPTNLLSSEVISEAIAIAARMPKHVNTEQHRLF